MLTGTVETPLDAKRAADLATIFVTRRRSDHRPVFADRRGGGSPTAASTSTTPTQERRVSQIVNLLQIIGDDQVTLKVTVAEVSRNVMKQLGVNMIGTGDSNGISWGAISDNLPGLGKPLSAVAAVARHVDARRLPQRDGAVGRHEDAGRADA